MKKKILATLCAAVLAVLSLQISVSAQDTTDYTYGTDEVIDFCVYNTWGVKSIECDKATVKSILMTVEVSDFSGDPVTVRLYNRESTTWGYWLSDPQVIDSDGTYTFYVDCNEGAYDSSTLCTIYLKDVTACTADEDAEYGQGNTASNCSCHIVLDDIAFNVAAPSAEEDASAEGTEVTVSLEDGAETTDTTDAAAAEDTEEAEKYSWEISDGAKIAVIVLCVIVFIAIFAGVFISRRKKHKK